MCLKLIFIAGLDILYETRKMTQRELKRTTVGLEFLNLKMIEKVAESSGMTAVFIIK
jgi:hypothetical protein